MDRIRHSRPSPALVIAILALVAGLAGSAVAGPLAETSKKPVRKTAKKVANCQITKRAPGLAVATANAASEAPPFAYAKVETDGSVLPAVSRNVVSDNVTNPAPGVYCFNLPFTPVHGQVTGEAEADADDLFMLELAQVDALTPPCPAGSEVLVLGYDVGEGNAANDEFYIELHR
jgi:hypothetical protein